MLPASHKFWVLYFYIFKMRIFPFWLMDYLDAFKYFKKWIFPDIFVTDF